MCKTVVEYNYDSYGKLLSTTGSMAGTVGKANPFRYRGYYYDNESGLYYLNSRYYDPQTGRFVNADGAIGQIGNVHGHNMFCYAFNNPVMYHDQNGNWPSLSQIFTAVAVGSVVVAAVAITVVTCGASAPALAVAGGGIIGGISAGSVATAASVATGALFIAGVSSAATVASSATEKSYNRKINQIILFTNLLILYLNKQSM